MEHFVKLAPESQSAMAWSQRGREVISIDFSTTVPHFQPTQIHRVFDIEQMLFVAGYDQKTGDGMLVQLLPFCDQGESIKCTVAYRGSCFGIAWDMYAVDNGNIDFYILEELGSIQHLDLETGKHEEIMAAATSSLLARCRFLAPSAVSDLGGNFVFSLSATENEQSTGCIPSIPLGANVTLVKRSSADGFELLFEHDYETDPLTSLLPFDSIQSAIAE